MTYTIKHTDKSGLAWFEVGLYPSELNGYKERMEERYGKVPYFVTIWDGESSRKIEERPDHNKEVLYFY